MIKVALSRIQGDMKLNMGENDGLMLSDRFCSGLFLVWYDDLAWSSISCYGGWTRLNDKLGMFQIYVL